jgi:hypothetical protein
MCYSSAATATWSGCYDDCGFGSVTYLYSSRSRIRLVFVRALSSCLSSFLLFLLGLLHMCKYINIQIPSILNEAEVLMHGSRLWYCFPSLLSRLKYYKYNFHRDSRSTASTSGERDLRISRRTRTQSPPSGNPVSGMSALLCLGHFFAAPMRERQSRPHSSPVSSC